MNDVLQGKVDNLDEKAIAFSQGGRQPKSKRHSSSKRRNQRHKQYGASPHLELRLQLLSESDDEESSKAQQEGLHAADQLVDAAGAGYAAHAASAQLQAYKQQGQALQQAQQHMQQQGGTPQCCLQEVVPESPSGAGSPYSMPAVCPSLQEDDVVPGTPDDVSCNEGNANSLAQQEQQQFEIEFAPVGLRPQQQEQQAELQQHVGFSFPQSAAKQAAVTPTIGLRTSSRMDGNAADGTTLQKQFEAEAAVDGVAAYARVQLRDDAEQQHITHLQQLQKLPPQQQQQQDTAFKTPSTTPKAAVTSDTAAAGDKAAGAGAESAGLIPGVNFVGCTPSSASTKQGQVSPSDDQALLAIMDSFDRKQPTRSCIAPVAVPSASSAAAAAVEVAQAAAPVPMAANLPMAADAGAEGLQQAGAKMRLVEAILGPLSGKKGKQTAGGTAAGATGGMELQAADSLAPKAAGPRHVEAAQIKRAAVAEEQQHAVKAGARTAAQGNTAAHPIAAVPPCSPVLGLMARSTADVDKTIYVQQWLQQQADTPGESLGPEVQQQQQLQLQKHQSNQGLQTFRKQQQQQQHRTPKSSRHTQLELKKVHAPPTNQQQLLGIHTAARAAVPQVQDDVSTSPVIRDSAMDLLPQQQQGMVQQLQQQLTAQQDLIPSGAMDCAQQQQQPGVSPTNLSDRSAGSGSKSAYSLTPGTLAEIEKLEQQYAQPKAAAERADAVLGPVAAAVPAAGAGNAGAHAGAPAGSAAVGLPVPALDQVVADRPTSSCGKPPRPPVTGLATAAAAAAAASHRSGPQPGPINGQQQQQQQPWQGEDMQQRQYVQTNCEAQAILQLSKLQGEQQWPQPQQQRLIQQQRWPQQQQHQWNKQQQQQQQQQAAAESPTAKRRHCLEQQAMLRQQQQHVGAAASTAAGSSAMPAESPFPTKVLFDSVVVPGSGDYKQPAPRQQPQLQKVANDVAHWQQQQWLLPPPAAHHSMVQAASVAVTCSVTAADVQPIALFADGSNRTALQEALARGPAATAARGQAADTSEHPGYNKAEAANAAASESPTFALATVTAPTAAIADEAAAAAPTAAPAAATTDESSDTDSDDIGLGYGIYSQAAAVARMMRVSQRLDEQYRVTQLQQLQQHRKETEQQYASQRAAMDTDSDDEQQPEQQQQQQADDPAAAAATPSECRMPQPGLVAAADMLGSDSEIDLELRSLSSYLPQVIVDKYKDMGLTKPLYVWQAECLNTADVLDGRNLVYAAPTSGGKSLVAEVLMLRRILSTGQPALLVMPYVSLCSQKAAHLSKLLEPMGKEVKSLYGGLGGTALTATTGVVVCTIEKANQLVNKLLEEDSLGSISCVVVDELHMVGDDDRGYLLELMLTKLRYATQSAKEEEERQRAEYQQQLQQQREARRQHMKQQHQGNSPRHDLQNQQDPSTQPDCSQLPSANSTPDMGGSDTQLQIIGMSATLPNVQQVATWLDARLYETSYRPVELREYVKIGTEIRNKQGELVRKLSVPDGWESKADPDQVALLANETVQAGHCVLVFCCSKLQCEIVAKLLARLLTVPERAARKPAKGDEPRTRAEFVEELARYGKKEYPLKDVMSKGVAFHHAGLTADERELVEKAYESGAISVLCATSTLAAGVNLPARRVIFKHAYVGRPDHPLDSTKYRQMSGRAGRAGLDTEGESFLIANQGNLNKLMELMSVGSEPVSSCLIESRRGMKRAMLEVVAAGVVSSSPDVERYLKCSLLAASEDYHQVAAPSTLEALKWLAQKGFLRWENESSAYGATDFGKATAAAGLDPAIAVLVKKDLEKARLGLCLASDLHLTYLVTPFHHNDLPDLQQQHWQLLESILQRQTGMSPCARVIEFIGLDRNYVMQRSRGARAARDDMEKEKERVAKRFFAALALTELISGELEPADIAQSYRLGIGQVEGLQEKAGGFAHTIVSFCDRHGWSDLESLFSKFQGRVSHGVRAEMVALTEIPYVKGARAKLLYKAGLRTPEAVAAADVQRILEILMSMGPKEGKDKDQRLKQEKRAAKGMIQGAKDLVAQKARQLAEQQEALLAAAAAPATGVTQGSTHSLAIPKSPLSASRLRAELQRKEVMSQKQQQEAMQPQLPNQQQQQQERALLSEQRSNGQQLLPQPEEQQRPHQQMDMMQIELQQDRGGQLRNRQATGSHQQQLEQPQALQGPQQHQQVQGLPPAWQQQAIQQQSAEQQVQQLQQQQQQQVVQQQSAKQQLWRPQLQQQQQHHHHEQQWYQQHLAQQQQQYQMPVQQQQGIQQQQQQRLPWSSVQQQQQRDQQPPQQQQPPRKRLSPESDCPQPGAKRQANLTTSATPAAAAGMHTSSNGAAAHQGVAPQNVMRSDMPPPTRNPSLGQQPMPDQDQEQAGANRGNAVVVAAAAAAAAVTRSIGKQQQKPAAAAAVAGASDGSSRGGVISASNSGGQQMGITLVKDLRGMQQLIDTLAACKCWGFSVAFDSDQAPKSEPFAAPGKLDLKLPVPPRQRSGGSGAGRSGAGAMSGFGLGGSGGSAAAGGGSGSASAAAAAAGVDEVTVIDEHSTDDAPWSWSVLGVAFSTCDSCAYYVPLTRRVAGSAADAAATSTADADTVRVGTGQRLQQLWEGLQHIFTKNRPGNASSSSKHAVAAAGAAINAAINANMPEKGGRKDAICVDAPGCATARVWLSLAPVRVTYGFKQQLAMLACPPADSGLKGFVIGEPVVDVRLAGWTLDPDMKVTQEDRFRNEPGVGRKGSLTKGLEELLTKFGSGSKQDVTAAIGGLPRAGGGRHLHACKRACMALKLHGILKGCLQVECVLPVLMGIEMPMVRLLACMEARGIAVKLDVLKQQQQPMQKRIMQLEEAAGKLHAAHHKQYGKGSCHLHNGGRCKDGGAFKLSSPAEVSKVLFGCLGLPPPPCAENKKNPRGNLSTKEEVLLELLDQHEMPGIIRQHRKLTKLLEGFMHTLEKQVKHSAAQNTPAAAATAGAGSLLLAAGGGPGTALLAGGADSGYSSVESAAQGLVRIRGNFLQTNTSTGRLSMEDPSFQTIPRPVEFEITATQAHQHASQAEPGSRDAVAAAVSVLTQQVNKQLSNIRAAFVAPAGSVLMSADYCQIELRLMAHFSQDEALLAALRDPAQDPFVEMAASWRNMSKSQVSIEQRNHAKRIAYGLLYGMGPAALGTELGISMGAAKELMDDFQQKHPKLDAWLKDIIARCKRTGWISTIAGRRRHLPHISAEGNGACHQRAQAERQAVNSVHQGSAADIVKLAMLDLAEQLEAQGFTEHGRLLLQVHDELLFEVSQSHLRQVAALVRNVMERAAEVWGLSVPLPVKLSVGPSWGQLELYK